MPVADVEDDLTAFVPGAAFYAGEPETDTLRLSFVTLKPEQIERAVQVLADVLRREQGA